jgi:AcrR family transcriptional regulator
MAVRTTRGERQARTRAALVEAACAAFLAHGYDGASLARIADAAGVTTGAVYANFADKDDLLFAVFDARAADSIRGQSEIAAADLSLDDALRAIARFLLGGSDEDPRWAALTAEYWARAARHPRVREVAAERHASILAQIGELVEQLAARHGMRLTIGAREVARGGGALARGIRLEQALALDDAAGAAGFEEMFRVFVRGLMRPAESVGREPEGGS